MMAESRFPIVFEKCPHCGCTETLTKLAWDEEAEKGRVNKDTPVAAEHLKVPLIDPTKTIGITGGILLLHVDWCANPECGRRRLVKAEVVTGKVGIGPPPGQQGWPSGGQGFGMPPFMGKG
jgi:hypothetical protein